MARPPAAEVSFEMLREHRLFVGINDETVRMFVEQLPCKLVEPGAVVIDEGDVASHMFIVVHGELEVLTQGTSGPVRVALLGPGDWVGEMAILDVQPRSATVRALSPTLALTLTNADLRRLTYERDPEQYTMLIVNVARELSRRLRVADRLIANSGATMAQEYVHLSMRPPA